MTGATSRSASGSRGRARRAAATARAGTAPTTCPGCGGAGRIQQVSRTVLGQIVRTGACPRCDGSGRSSSSPASAARATGGPGGRPARARRPGRDPRRAAHPGPRRGHAGVLGGPPGDVYVTVARAVARRGRARRRRPPGPHDGDDDRGGARRDGDRADAGGGAGDRARAGTQPGAMHSVRGRGMPSLESGRRGNLLVGVDVRIPTRLTGEQRAELLALRGRARGRRVPRRRRRLPRKAEERLPVTGEPSRTALGRGRRRRRRDLAPWRRRFHAWSSHAESPLT